MLFTCPIPLIILAVLLTPALLPPNPNPPVPVAPAFPVVHPAVALVAGVAAVGKQLNFVTLVAPAAVVSWRLSPAGSLGPAFDSSLGSYPQTGY